MKRVSMVAAVLAISCLWADWAAAGSGTIKGWAARRQSQTHPWHGDYYDTAWGTPVAVVVPPTAESQAHLGWGVGATRVTPIQHQFGRNYPGPSEFHRSWFHPTPAWPSSTDQFGDYYIRGPW